jgi:hypothetical protein
VFDSAKATATATDCCCYKDLRKERKKEVAAAIADAALAAANAPLYLVPMKVEFSKNEVAFIFPFTDRKSAVDVADAPAGMVAVVVTACVADFLLHLSST